ncbi:uncharacterized protein LOC115970507 [Quercus lobata]|uniref:uncharacterized protein LOC115970507 n=1 Tax=Quercus lobata TaxID=97700 RepID=UPI001246AC88|nr:uncharacterized protein LOC115970507 [Quercus lobata]
MATPGRTGTHPAQVLAVAQLPPEGSQPGPKRARMKFRPVLSFSKEDKIGTIQPHDDALLVTLRIGNYDVKRVMVDGGNAAEVMYPDLYKGLGLKPEDLMPYNFPLMSFDGKLVIPMGMIRVPIQTSPEIVKVNFVVVDTYSPYTAIVDRPWLHTLGAVASSLHQKVKFSSGDQVFEIRGCQPTARMPGMPPESTHPSSTITSNPAITPKKQPPRCLSKEHADAIRDEVAKLKCAGAVKEVFYLEWLANTVVVKKKSGKWREKTVFVTPTGNYHYKVMLFSLKNAGSTYQRMMTRMFEPHLGKSIEIYVDDMVVKSRVVSEHLGDLGNTFGVLRKHKLRLNASKCSFGVGSGKFLGYMVTHRGIEINPDQIKAINNLKPPQNAKEVQKLTGMITALNRFISRSADRCRPFYLLINKWKGFEWSEDCVVAF